MYLDSAGNPGPRQLALAYVNSDSETIALGVSKLAMCVKDLYRGDRLRSGA